MDRDHGNTAGKPPEKARRLGILGGMGPEATVLLMARIVAATPANDDNDHIPMLIDNNPKVPSRIAALLEGADIDPAPVLVTMAQNLEASGVTALAMPCNTAHAYVPKIRDAVSIPFLDMIALTADHVAQLDAPPAMVGLLASPAVKTLGIYEQHFSAHGIAVQYPSDQDQILAAIRRLKKDGSDRHAIAILQASADELIASGVTTILVGCTEFSLATHEVSKKLPQGCRIVDALDVLVAACVKHGLAT